MPFGAFSAKKRESGRSESPIGEVKGALRWRRNANRNGRSERWAVAAIALSALACNLAFAADEISGTYVKDKRCRGDGTDAKPLVVKITPDEISYYDGVCALSERRQDGSKISVRATCKTKKGKILSGDITFTLRADRNLDMVDQDKANTSVLNRCPE
jgi:hypothetical protein